MRGGSAPPLGGTGRFDSVADIFAVGNRGLPDQLARLVKHVAGIATIGARLLTTNKKLGSTVHRLRFRRIPFEGLNTF